MLILHSALVNAELEIFLCFSAVQVSKGAPTALLQMAHNYRTIRARHTSAASRNTRILAPCAVCSPHQTHHSSSERSSLIPLFSMTRAGRGGAADRRARGPRRALPRRRLHQQRHRRVGLHGGAHVHRPAPRRLQGAPAGLTKGPLQTQQRSKHVRRRPHARPPRFIPCPCPLSAVSVSARRRFWTGSSAWGSG